MIFLEIGHAAEAHTFGKHIKNKVLNVIWPCLTQAPGRHST